MLLGKSLTIFPTLSSEELVRITYIMMSSIKGKLLACGSRNSCAVQRRRVDRPLCVQMSHATYAEHRLICYINGESLVLALTENETHLTAG